MDDIAGRIDAYTDALNTGMAALVKEKTENPDDWGGTTNLTVCLVMERAFAARGYALQKIETKETPNARRSSAKTPRSYDDGKTATHRHRRA